MRRYEILICIFFLGSILIWNNHAFAKETDFEKSMRIGLGEQKWNELVDKKGEDFSKWRFGLFERHGVVLEALAGWRMGNGYFAMERGDISSQDEFNRLWSSLTTATDRSTRSTVKGIGIIGDWVNAIRGVSSVDSDVAKRVLRESGYEPTHSQIIQAPNSILQTSNVGNVDNKISNKEEKIPTLVINIPGIVTRGSQSADEFGKTFFPSYEKFSVQYEGVASKIPLINLLPWFKPGEKPGTKNVITIPQRVKDWQQKGSYAWEQISKGFTKDNNVVIVNIDQNKIIPAQAGNLGDETLVPALHGIYFVDKFKEQFPNGRIITKSYSDGDWIVSMIAENRGEKIDVWIGASKRLPFYETEEILNHHPNIQFVGIGSQGDFLNIGVQAIERYSGYARPGGSNYKNIEIQSRLNEFLNPFERHSIVENYSKNLPLKVTTPDGTFKTMATIKDILYPIVTGKRDGYSMGGKFKADSLGIPIYLPVYDPSKKYYGDDYRKYFPPPGCPPFCGDGGGAAAVPSVGGVLLDMPADIVGLNTAEVSGAIWDDRKKQLSLVVKGDVVAFPKTYLDDFVSILMTVYGGEDPGISIDPGGYTDQCNVRYIGKVKNTRFGRTLFEADRLLKSLSLGKDTLTGYPINPGIPDFKTMVQLFEEYGMKYSGALYRFWFVPLEMRIRQSGNSFVFDKARLEVKTEYMFKKGKKSETEPAARAFAEFLTMHYDEFAYRYPVLRDLVEYAKMVSLAQWLKEQDVPLNWFLFANSYAENIPTPDVTPAMFSEHPRYSFEVWGGVDFRITNEYLPTTGPMPIVSEAALAKYSTQFTDVPVWNVGDTSWNVTGVSPGKKFEVKDEVYTAIGMPSTTMVSNGRKLVFHTDAVMHSSPRIELIRYYIGNNHQPSEFGYGWSLLVPYKLEPTDDKRITYQDVSLPERMTVVDLISNKKEVLKFENKKYINVGYFPEESVQFKGLLLMSDASFQLIDRWGNSFHFDQGGRLMVADMGKENKWFYVYKGEKIIGMFNEEEGEIASEIKFEHDPNGRIEKAVIANKGAIKGEVSYVYDAKGDLVKVIGMDGKVTDYQYNNSHMLLSLIPSRAGWKMWHYVVASFLGLIFCAGIFLAYKKIRRGKHEDMS